MTAEDTGMLDSMLHTWDYMSADHDRVKWEIFGYARERCPVARTAEGGGFWLVTRFEDVKRVLEDWETFSSTESPVTPSAVGLCPITDDPPVQTAARQLLNPLFSRGAVAGYEPAMRAAARDLIAKWIDRGSVELLTEFSGPYVSAVLTEAVFPDFGPEDLARAATLAAGLHRPVRALRGVPRHGPRARRHRGRRGLPPAERHVRRGAHP
jgi:cytochrome P450